MRFAAILGLLLASLAHAETVRVPGTGITFQAPVGFKPLTQEMLEAKFPSRTGPAQAIGNERGTTTIAYDIRDVAVTSAALEQQLPALSEQFVRVVPGGKVIERKMVEVDGEKWAYVEFASNAIDTDIHNIVLLGPSGGGMVVFNFNATKSDFTLLEDDLRASIASIRIGAQPD